MLLLGYAARLAVLRFVPEAVQGSATKPAAEAPAPRVRLLTQLRFRLRQSEAKKYARISPLFLVHGKAITGGRKTGCPGTRCAIAKILGNARGTLRREGMPNFRATPFGGE